MSKWMTQDWTAGQLNALVKNIGEANARAIIAGKAKFEITIQSILDFVTAVSLPAEPRFVAREKFVVNTSDSAEVKIVFIWDGFAPFLDAVEEQVAEAEIAVHKLEKDSLDKSILEELGDKARITLSQFYAMLLRQGNGQPGALLTNGYANIAYIEGFEKLVVYAYWNAGSGGWSVSAYSVTNPRGWGTGGQVLSRN
jgi:hypothetical protein